MPSKVFLFFRFNRNDRDKLYHLQKSHLCHSLTHGRRLCEPGTSRPSLPSSLGSFLTNGTASSVLVGKFVSILKLHLVLFDI